MILKIPVVIGDETVIGLFHRDHVSVALPRDKGEATALHVHGIMEPFLACVPHKLLAQFLSRAHSETHGSLDYEKSVRTKVDATSSAPRGLGGSRLQGSPFPIEPVL